MNTSAEFQLPTIIQTKTNIGTFISKSFLHFQKALKHDNIHKLWL